MPADRIKLFPDRNRLVFPAHRDNPPPGLNAVLGIFAGHISIGMADMTPPANKAGAKGRRQGTEDFGLAAHDRAGMDDSCPKARQMLQICDSGDA
jgi:hypothetical protein